MTFATIDSQELKRCSKCHIEKPYDAFNWRSDNNTYRSQCKACAQVRLTIQQRLRRAKNPEKHRTYMDTYRIANRERILKNALQSHYRRKFGLTIEERNQMLAEQGGVCAICQGDNSNSKRDWHIDHCHETQCIRGILCADCNAMLGRARDKITTLQNAIAYLRRFR